MRELEAKLFLGETEPSVAYTKLSDMGIRLSDPISQEDFVYATALEVLMNPVPGTVVARIRVESDRTPSLTVKERRASELDRTECEFGIDDPKAARQAFEMLGLSNLVTVRKIRRVGTVKPDVSVCLDQVDGLGLFLEIEVLSEDDESADETLAETIELVGKTFGDSLPRVTKGYDRLLIEAQ